MSGNEQLEMVFPLDGGDTRDVVTLRDGKTGNLVGSFPRLWQLPEGVVDLNDVLRGVEHGEETAFAQFDLVGEWYRHRVLFAVAAARLPGGLAYWEVAKDDEVEVEELLASLTDVERAEVERTFDSLRKGEQAQ